MPNTPLSITIIALNEERKIRRAIESVQWADDILVVDSGSTDQTVSIAKSLGARVIHNPWPGYGQQKNFAQAHALHSWVLNIDADEYISEPLCKKIQSLLQTHALSHSTSNPKVLGFEIPRKTLYLGRWIRHGGWYPNYLVRLAHRDFAKWSEPQVHEQLVVTGKTERIEEPLCHDAFDTIADQILTNLRFAQLGSEDLARKGRSPSVVKMIFKPLWKFFETYLLKKGFLDGLPGFIISVNAAHSMFLKYAFLSEATLLRRPPQTEVADLNSKTNPRVSE